ncbi:unnamed protein product [Didymodactylos carnosus]|uniref:Secreted protein n=1 Tax=Didymodactylos carnosus TaxID=1234261 RepID=A0A8S2EYI6_9BILA|nr:unnamed protein product [Didymodactylos carnosus]CAF4096634.1 unnamed protein product [Didymodactylos carnosus]
MHQSLIGILFLLLSTTIAAFIEIDIRRKLVCSQPDGSYEGPRDYCYQSNDQTCECTGDCTSGSGSSSSECVCTRSDLVYAKEHDLANCSIWTQGRWENYVEFSRRRATVYHSAPPASNTPDGQGLLFLTHDQNLAWPITAAQETGNLLPHGPHCLDMIEDFNQQILEHGKLKNMVDESHYDHCRRLTRRVLAYYEDEQPKYHVTPKSLCNDIFQLYDKSGKKIPITSRTVTYTVAYQNKRLTVNNTEIDDLELAHGIYNELLNETQNMSQQKLFERISGQNLGDLLVKDWLEQELTAAEKSFLHAWESDRVVRIAAISIYCIQGEGKQAPIDKIRSLLTLE